MTKRRKEQGDPFAELKEWQGHRLDPGYFTGGRIHPVLKGRRPNRYGYVLLVGGLISVFALGGMVRSGQTWMMFSAGLGGVVGIAAGLALLRRGSGSSRHGS